MRAWAGDVGRLEARIIEKHACRTIKAGEQKVLPNATVRPWTIFHAGSTSHQTL